MNNAEISRMLKKIIDEIIKQQELGSKAYAIVEHNADGSEDYLSALWEMQEGLKNGLVKKQIELFNSLEKMEINQ